MSWLQNEALYTVPTQILLWSVHPALHSSHWSFSGPEHRLQLSGQLLTWTASRLHRQTPWSRFLWRFFMPIWPEDETKNLLQNTMSLLNGACVSRDKVRFICLLHDNISYFAQLYFIVSNTASQYFTDNTNIFFVGFFCFFTQVLYIKVLHINKGCLKIHNYTKIQLQFWIIYQLTAIINSYWNITDISYQMYLLSHMFWLFFFLIDFLLN